MNREARNAAVSYPPTRKAVLLAAAIQRRSSYGSNHPLAIPRVSLTLDLIRSYGALSPEECRAARPALPGELRWFHTRDYVQALQRVEALGRALDRHRRSYNIGNVENPYFPGVFTIPATATGASIQGAEEVLAGRIAFNPAGGMHHAMPAQARGFCYFNDPVLGILRLRQAGLRVLYLDIDAHHGDGVELAFRGDGGVLTVSIHMDTTYAYPFRGGAMTDWGPLANSVNLPLPAGVNDSEYRVAFTALWPAVVSAFGPEVVVLQAGTDILRPDPLGKFAISTQLFLELVESVVAASPRHGDGTPRLLVVGGGGYHPLALARCWTGVWAILSGRELPLVIPASGQALLRTVGWDDDEGEDYYPRLFSHRVDLVHEGPMRAEVAERVERLLTIHPLFGGRI